MADETLPPLDTGSLDLNALHNALMDDFSPEEAMANAMVRAEPTYTAEQRGGGWLRISGPEGFETYNTQDHTEAQVLWSELTAAPWPFADPETKTADEGADQSSEAE